MGNALTKRRLEGCGKIYNAALVALQNTLHYYYGPTALILIDTTVVPQKYYIIDVYQYKQFIKFDRRDNIIRAYI